jgi:hypothetical protein
MTFVKYNLLNDSSKNTGYNDFSGGNTSEKFFNNLPEIMKAVAVADLLGISIKTIYDWRYKQKTRNIPNDLFIKINRLLYLRTAVLRKWITSQNQFLI